jgi:hypothetical protein
MVADEGIRSRQNSSIGGEKENAENNQEEERRKERKLKTTMTPIQSNEWGPRDSRPFRQAFPSETQMNDDTIPDTKCTTQITGGLNNSQLHRHTRTITQSCDTFPTMAKEIKEQKTKFSHFQSFVQIITIAQATKYKKQKKNIIFLFVFSYRNKADRQSLIHLKFVQFGFNQFIHLRQLAAPQRHGILWSSSMSNL